MTERTWYFRFYDSDRFKNSRFGYGTTTQARIYLELLERGERDGRWKVEVFSTGSIEPYFDLETMTADYLEYHSLEKSIEQETVNTKGEQKMKIEIKKEQSTKGTVWTVLADDVEISRKGGKDIDKLSFTIDKVLSVMTGMDVTTKQGRIQLDRFTCDLPSFEEDDALLDTPLKLAKYVKKLSSICLRLKAEHEQTTSCVFNWNLTIKEDL